MTTSQVRLVAVLPRLLGTYGDGGNLLVLRKRLQWRGIGCQLMTVDLGDPVPADGDLYVIGGGEDEAQVVAARALAGSGLVKAVTNGAHVFAVCAGLQVLGSSFVTPAGLREPGLGLLDVESDRLAQRALGEVVVEPDPLLGLALLTGFENHGGRTVLGPAARPLGRVLTGIGNGDGDGPAVEGALQGCIVGTYLHGPALARNPALADLLLARVLGSDLDPLDDADHDQLRVDRLGA